jgi:hypothetical protein
VEVLCDQVSVLLHGRTLMYSRLWLYAQIFVVIYVSEQPLFLRIILDLYLNLSDC